MGVFGQLLSLDKGVRSRGGRGRKRFPAVGDAPAESKIDGLVEWVSCEAVAFGTAYAPCTRNPTYLHVRPPPLHRGGAVLEPAILPIRAFLVRDGL